MSRHDARSRRLRHRPSRVVAASLVATVMVVVAALTVVVVVARLMNRSWPGQVSRAAASLTDLRWDSTATTVAAAVLTVLGLVLLTAGIKPGPFRTTSLRAPAGREAHETDYVISTRAMARLAAAHADTVDGVDAVAASASPNRVRLKITTTSERADEIGEQVRQRVADALAAAGLETPPRVTATVRTKGI